jgi:hypothetical protein
VKTQTPPLGPFYKILSLGPPSRSTRASRSSIAVHNRSSPALFQSFRYPKISRGKIFTHVSKSSTRIDHVAELSNSTKRCCILGTHYAAGSQPTSCFDRTVFPPSSTARSSPRSHECRSSFSSIFLPNSLPDYVLVGTAGCPCVMAL